MLRFRDLCAIFVWGRVEWIVKYRGGDFWILGFFCFIRVFCVLFVFVGCYRY